MNVLILSYNKYPDGDAGAIRQHSFAKLFSIMGNYVFIIGMGESPYLQKMSYDGVDYVSFRNLKKNIIAKFRNILGYKHNLRNFLKDNMIKFDIILVVDIPFTALFFIKRYAKRNNIMLIHDSVEWYSPEQFRYGKFSIPYILKDLYNKKLINKQFNIIAISKFLEEHFKRKGCCTCRIPVIMDINNISWIKHTNKEKLTLVYAGTPGRKDYLNEIIRGISKLPDEELKKLEFRIIGITKEQAISSSIVSIDILQRLCNVIDFKGRLLRYEVLRNLEEADFTVLLRSPTLRYAKAGFPTKVVESLASGTPVICNITSDLDDYLVDGYNSILVEKCTAEAFANSIKRALSLTYEQKKDMYRAARKCAEENFDYRLYINELKKWINRIGEINA